MSAPSAPVFRFAVALAVCTAAATLAVSCAEDRYDPDDPDSQVGPIAPPDLPPESTNALCSDGIDNDQDGAIDCCDLDCDEEVYPDVTVCRPPNPPVPEVTVENCFDCIDNDDNGFLDCNDFSCSENNQNVECPREDSDELCSDQIDNDFDGFIDCQDFSCQEPEITVCN